MTYHILPDWRNVIPEQIDLFRTKIYYPGQPLVEIKIPGMVHNDLKGNIKYQLDQFNHGIT